MNIPQQQIIPLEYTPADYFYLTNSSDTPSSDQCTGLLTTDAPSCAGATDPLILKQCYQAELCRNQALVEQMFEKRGKHSKADTKLLDFKSKYQFEIVTSINLGIGIIGTLVYIYYNRNE